MGKGPIVYSFDSMAIQRLCDKVFRRYIDGVNITFVHFELKKGALVVTYHHPSEQISYIVHGKMKVTSDGKTYIVSAGDVIQIPPQISHQFEALEDSVVIDTFSPPRKDWLQGNEDYLKHGMAARRGSRPFRAESSELSMRSRQGLAASYGRRISPLPAESSSSSYFSQGNGRLGGGASPSSCA